jgi:hypothetical protein
VHTVNFGLNSFTSLMAHKAKRADYNGSNLTILPGVKHREAFPNVILQPHLGRTWKANGRKLKGSLSLCISGQCH